MKPGDMRMRKGISGGERKRLSIALEMVWTRRLRTSSDNVIKFSWQVHSPRVLLHDEPTSGLDSSSANQVALYIQRRHSVPLTIFAALGALTAAQGGERRRRGRGLHNPPALLSGLCSLR